MPPDPSPREDPRTILRALGLRPRRALSQSFLVDRDRLEKLAAAAVPGPGWSVVEIGPGTGALTGPLAQRAARLVAIEADAALAEATGAAFADRAHVQVRRGDAREFDFAAPELPRPLAVAGNIPYHLTGLLLRVVLDADPPPDRVVFLLQREVADRLVAGPGSRTYGALSVLVGAAWSVRRLFRVPRGAFHPPPQVDSAAVLCEPLAPPRCPRESRAAFRRVVMAAFEHRRQTLRNALRHGGIADEQVARLAGVAGVRLDHRPEEHGVDAFVAMARAVE